MEDKELREKMLRMHLRIDVLEKQLRLQSEQLDSQAIDLKRLLLLQNDERWK